MATESDDSFIDRWIALAVFLLAAALFIHSAGPGLAAYRDAGEMVVALGTLGVAHPPGYPLYVLLGSLAARLPLGCVALRAAFFSGLCGAAAVALLFLIVQRFAGRLAGIAVAAVMMTGNPFWELSAVPEMYALGALFLLAVIYAAFVAENAALAGFLFGLSLGVRLDLLLLAPAFAWPFLRRPRQLLAAAGFAALGATVFLYLPIRSLQQPMLDWGDPETFERFWNAVTRRSYGGGLDLLSQAYHSGENFTDGLALLGRHAWRNAGPLALLAALGGLMYGRRSQPETWRAVILGLALTGPVFLYMANLPPNPHAVAILEAAFITPMILLGILAALGLTIAAPRWRSMAAGALLLSAAWTAAGASHVAIRRDAWTARDYTEAVLRSAPRSAIVVFHKDVQLFNLWEAQVIEGRRPDLRILATGLSNSPWYWTMIERWPGGPVPDAPLTSAAGIAQFVATGRLLVTGYETDLPTEVAAEFKPYGLLRVASPATAAARPVDFLNAVAGFRVATAERARDFFSVNLLSDVARALHESAIGVVSSDPALADLLFRRSAEMDPDFPAAISDRAYLKLVAGRSVDARDLYAEAAAGFERLLNEAAIFRSLPDVVEPIRTGLVTALVQEGVASERTGDVDAARALYRRSIDVEPTSQAHYNLGVTYWGKDWTLAAENFERAVTLDPANAQARGYAEAARRHAGGRP